MKMISEGEFVLFEGYLREVVGEINDNLIIENEAEYIIIPNKAYPVYTLKDFFSKDS